MMPILVKADDFSTGVNTNTHYDQLRLAQESMG